MSRPPPLTIVTVVRNDREGLRRTWESLAAQTWQDFHWRVQDGASTDGSAEWLATVRREHFDYVSEPDRSLFDAMNRTLARLESDYCLFLNAGDRFLTPGVLARAMPALLERRPPLAYGKVVIGALPGLPERVVGRRLRRRWELFWGRLPCHQTLFVSREVFRQLRGYDEELGVFADTDWILGYTRERALEDCLFFDFPMVHYDPRGRSYTHYLRHWRGYLRSIWRQGNAFERAVGLAGFLKGCAYSGGTRGLGWLQALSPR